MKTNSKCGTWKSQVYSSTGNLRLSIFALCHSSGLGTRVNLFRASPSQEIDQRQILDFHPTPVIALDKVEGVGRELAPQFWLTDEDEHSLSQIVLIAAFEESRD